MAYAIELEFRSSLTQTQRSAFERAARRWMSVIVGDLPRIQINGRTIEGLLISAEVVPIDGRGNILGQSGPTFLRGEAAGVAAYLPAQGEMKFDIADVADMEAKGTLDDVIAHEMGHVIGFGMIWAQKRLLKGAGSVNPLFLGAQAMAAYRALAGPGASAVPVEEGGTLGSRDAHWRDALFGNELMTGALLTPGNPLSALTVASLGDLGYGVNSQAAEPYALPDHAKLVASAALAKAEKAERGKMWSTVPSVLPDQALVD
ncbi:hypothetical protein QO010_000269 [Caulobacter ginsengisoli]|uniref:Peptidase n=1 Tax=Caulobacter ginsengisoli TaxID=400775 RepID=A0ABU0IKH4_9CAUL|nr:leishmanolysin-related zinc metalloendopeptidase [Caulobacter ginsengisoli]MDQ0462521.1 hypothetical protein [Caulobacter ginsengisoli]